MEFTISQKEYEQLLVENQRLKEQNNLLRKALFASKSERHPIKESQPEEIDLWDENPEDAPKATAAEKEHINYKRKKRSKDQNRKPLPEHLERKDEIVELPEEERVCDDCGKEMVEIGEEISEELEIIPQQMYVRRIRRKKYACKTDSLHGVFRAKMPKRIIPKGIAGPALLSHILISKYVDHLPLERQEQIFKRSKIHIPKTSMSDWMGKVCRALDPLLDCLKNKMLDSRILNADETTFKVQKNSKKQGIKTGYLWSYIGDRKWVWFDWQPGRSQQGPLDILSGFTGDYLQSDGYAGYNAIVNKLDLEHLGCWAHARRKFVEAYEAGAKQAEPTIKLIAQLYKVEKEIKDIKGKNKGFKSESIESFRTENSIPVLQQIHNVITELSQSAVPKGALGKAISYTLIHWDQLTKYCDDGDLEIDNNIVERAVRPVALGRKNYLFAGSESGATWAASFYSLIETCKLHGVNPAEYLTEVLRHLAEYEGEDMTTLLPDAYAWRYLPEK